MKFKFLRTVQYTEVVEVEAESFERAKEIASEEDGIRNHDDTPISLEETYESCKAT